MKMTSASHQSASGSSSYVMCLTISSIVTARIAAATPDVLILDLHLRNGSGFGVLRSLARGTGRRPKIVILTNFGLPEYRREAETFGVEAFLDKSRDYFRLPSLLTGLARDRAAQGLN